MFIQFRKLYVIRKSIMKSLLVFAGLLVICSGRILPGPFGGRIVNGEDVAVGEIPYQVSLQYVANNFHFCGGSVLNKDHVITAAHCVQGQQASEIKVIAGTVKLNEPVQTHFVEKIIVHEKYDPNDSWRNDIALVKIKKEFIVTAVLGFVPMPSPGQKVPADSPAIVSGWGRLRQGGMSPNRLQKAQILIADQEYCQGRYEPIGNNVHETHICAHDPVQETGSCNGDSGGPLTVNGKLVGLVSWAMGCAQTEYPTVYTRVSEFIDWIDEHLE